MEIGDRVHALERRGTGDPGGRIGRAVALLMNWSNPVMAQGAALAGLTLADAFEIDITEAVETGDLLEVDPAAGIVRILERATL